MILSSMDANMNINTHNLANSHTKVENNHLFEVQKEVINAFGLGIEKKIADKCTNLAQINQISNGLIEHITQVEL